MYSMFENKIAPFIRHFKQAHSETMGILSTVPYTILETYFSNNTFPIGEQVFIHRMLANHTYRFLEIASTESITAMTKGNSNGYVVSTHTIFVDSAKHLQKNVNNLTSEDIPEPIHILVYTGEHTYDAIYSAIKAAYKFLADESIIIINQWKYDSVQGKIGAINAFAKLNGKSHHIEEIPCLRGEVLYWRGFGVFLNEKLKLRFNANSTHDLATLIEKDEPCLFAKYGDGEFDSTRNCSGVNIDGTPYSTKLRTMLLDSLQIYKGKKNIFIGSVEEEYWERILGFSLQWSIYFTIIIHDYDIKDHLRLWKAIQQNTRKKIYIANDLMGKACHFFKIDKHIIIDRHRWFEDSFETVLQSVKNEIVDDSATMILTSGGMGAKPLLSKLYEEFPNAIYLDIGSAFDLICTGNQTRSWNIEYSKMVDYLQEIVPSNWRTPS